MHKTMTLTGLIALFLLLTSTAIHATAINGKKAGTTAAVTVKTEPATGSQPAVSEPRIKPTVSDRPNISSFNGGLVLSRVELKAGDDLSPYADRKAEDYNERSKSLTGLVVFHIGGANSKLAKGMYVWDGDKWQRVSFDL